MMLMDLVDACWTSWQSAMEEGTVAEWVVKHLAQNVVVADYIQRGGAKVVCGQDGVCRYYNKVLERAWGGDCSLTWGLEGAVVVAPWIIKVLFNLNVVPCKVGHVSRQMWQIRVNPVTHAMEEIVILPVIETPQQVIAPHGLGGRRASTSTTNSGSCYTSSSQNTNAPSCPPCGHNSWENVRIKRGWAVLRCRECSSQWRLRPSEIDRCQEFGKEIGRQCSLGESCPRMHVHFTRLKREAVLKQRQVVKQQLKQQAHMCL